MAGSDGQAELVFCPLGGVGEIGMNLALYGYGPANAREWIIFIPLIAGTIFLGFFSTPVTDMTAASVNQLISDFTAATAAAAN